MFISLSLLLLHLFLGLFFLDNMSGIEQLLSLRDW
jgi:hypothetical protein